MLIVRAESVKSTSGVQTAGADAQLVAANSERNALSVEVDAGGTGIVYLKLRAGAATAADWDVSLGPGGQWDGRIAGVLWGGAVRFFSTGTPKVAVIEV